MQARPALPMRVRQVPSTRARPPTPTRASMQERRTRGCRCRCRRGPSSPPRTVSLAGGAAAAPAGRAQPGGELHLVSWGGITFDATAPGPAAPAGAGTARRRAAAVVAGRRPLRARRGGHRGRRGSRQARIRARHHGVRRHLRRRHASRRRPWWRATGAASVSGGTVYVSAAGVIDTSGGAPGQVGGDVEIQAQQIVIVGRIASTGGGGEGPGAAAGGVDALGDARRRRQRSGRRPGRRRARRR